MELMTLLTKIVVFLYFTFNTVRVFSYVPQIIAVAKETSPAQAISLLTWSFWSMANLTTALYATVVLPDTLLAAMSYGNTLGCTIVVFIVCYKRKKYGKALSFYDLFAKRKIRIAQAEDVAQLLH